MGPFAAAGGEGLTTYVFLGMRDNRANMRLKYSSNPIRFPDLPAIMGASHE